MVRYCAALIGLEALQQLQNSQQDTGRWPIPYITVTLWQLSGCLPGRTLRAVLCPAICSAVSWQLQSACQHHRQLLAC